LAGHVLHREEVMALVGADRVDRHDVRMLDLGGGRGFAAEADDEIAAAGQLRRQHLDRHIAVQVGVVTLIHIPHPATAQASHNLVLAQPLEG
jgi:hypothetical protein